MLNVQEMEEERRLMYVGITRAKEKAYLLFTSERNIFGSTQCNPPSRFLDDIPEHLLETASNSNDQYATLYPNQKNNFYQKSYYTKASSKKMENVVFINKKDPKSYKLEANSSFKDGDHVEHPVFGSGLIISSQGDILTIAFKKVGLKKLSASVAPLKKV